MRKPFVGVVLVGMLFAMSCYAASSERLATCMQMAHYIKVGVNSQHNGFPRDVVWKEKAELQKILMAAGVNKGNPWPNEHLYIRDDGETDAQKASITESIEMGWDIAVAHPEIPGDYVEGQALERCMNGDPA